MLIIFIFHGGRSIDTKSKVWNLLKKGFFPSHLYKHFYCLKVSIFWALLVAQTVKNLPAMQKTQVLSLGCEGPLEKDMATHSSILAWRIPWGKEPGGLLSIGLQRGRQDWATNTFTFKHLLETRKFIQLWSLKKIHTGPSSHLTSVAVGGP